MLLGVDRIRRSTCQDLVLRRGQMALVVSQQYIVKRSQDVGVGPPVRGRRHQAPGNIYLNGADFDFVAGAPPEPGYIKLV